MARPIIGMAPEKGPFYGSPSGSLLNPGQQPPHMVVPDQTPEAPPAATHTTPDVAPVLATEGHFNFVDYSSGVSSRSPRGNARGYAYTTAGKRTNLSQTHGTPAPAPAASKAVPFRRTADTGR